MKTQPTSKNISKKNLSQSISAVLATALLSCSLFSEQAQAAPVTGDVRFVGTATVDDPNRSTFVSFSGVTVGSSAGSATGDFSGSEGSAVMMNGFQYEPFKTPVTPLWSFTNGLGRTFSFDLDTCTVNANEPGFISITGTGTLSASGAITRDPTFGLFTLTATNTDKGVVFGFSSQTSASPCLTGANLDPTFDGDGRVRTTFAAAVYAGAVALQADGKIVVAGYIGGADFDFALARYNADGSLDTSFDTDGKLTTHFGSGDDQAVAVAVQTDGKIVAAGRAFTGGRLDFALARYNTDGSLDTTFDTDGKVTTQFGPSSAAAWAVVVQPNGKIVAVGEGPVGSTFDFALARYNADGSLDTTFDSDGKVTTAFDSGNDQAFAVALQPDGKIVAAGVAQVAGSSDFALARYHTDGSLDTTFDTDGKVATAFGSVDQATAVAVQPDGKIVAAGVAVLGSAFNEFALARYNTDGALDLTFDADGKVTTGFDSQSDTALAVILQPDGKIVAVGFANSLNFALARYNADGALDPTFDSDGRVTTDFGSGVDSASAAVRQPDGKIVAAGVAEGGSTDFGLARYGTCVAALQLTTAVSRKTQGTLGPFDINLPLTSEPGVECRNSGGNHTLVFTFTNNVVSGNASVTSGAGVPASPTFAGNRMTVNLSGVNDVQKITVTLSNVTDNFAQVLPNTAVSMNLLIGDTNGNKSVNATDIGQTKGQSGVPVTATNFRQDVTPNGTINASDIGLVKSRSGASVP
jgi:uncharacterized delta-60 repeat protein